MDIVLASDHAGFELKEKTRHYLLEKGYSVDDCGAHTYDEDDDYPIFIAMAANKVRNAPETTRAIIFGGSGQGEAIVANRFKHVRAAVYASDNLELVTLAREHNNANVLSIGARFVSAEAARKAIALFLDTSFPGEERHERRIKQIDRG